MSRLSFSIEHWAAWAPGVETAAQWTEWSAGTRPIAEEPDRPDVGFLPAMLRRRTSRITKAALWAAHQCGAGENAWPTVFSSRHGELHRSHGLLSELAQDEPLSPNAFSLSVHNTASGLNSIATGNRAPSTALAAGKDTVAAGVIEAVGRLQAGADRVLLVHADERMPEFYRPWAEERPVVFAFGALLRAPVPGAAWSLERYRGDTDEASPESAPGLAFMHILAGGRDRLLMAGERNSWLWGRD
ncbi:beta-ketoacyl synthase chain length factor [Halofilum ochraceum]|uniref:beta-ketoacyl synthase chain length factor n=1 Tax=Halofilum ochraceum TaxID=1611323 RepID=UPI00082C51C7|nr:beta-ketoacyl synthase chain length factor [Halofilum ochraceum]